MVIKKKDPQEGLILETLRHDHIESGISVSLQV